MIAGIFHEGSGLGNQLHRYVATRVLALDKDYEWGMVSPQNFKGKDFMNIDMGKTLSLDYSHYKHFQEKKVVEDDVDIRGYDPEFNFIRNNIIIDGEFQDERYFGHRLKEIDEWLEVEPIDVPDDLCIIGFRGGEFALYPDLFLPMKYWVDGVGEMKKINPNMKFKIVTDDPKLAKSLFPFEVSHEISMDWRQMRYAKHAIIANSSFFILPRLLNGGVTIAPRYWARRNTKTWALPQNYYKCFTYL